MAWHQRIIIRYKLCMDSRLFAQIHNGLQMVVILKRQRNGNLVQIIFRQDIFNIFNSAYHFYALIQGSAWNPVVQYAPDHVPPLGICVDSGNIFLSRP